MPAVLIRMAENIGQLLQLADDVQRPVLEKHLDMVVAAGKRSIEDENDLETLQKRAQGAAKQHNS